MRWLCSCLPAAERPIGLYRLPPLALTFCAKAGGAVVVVVLVLVLVLVLVVVVVDTPVVVVLDTVVDVLGGRRHGALKFFFVPFYGFVFFGGCRCQPSVDALPCVYRCPLSRTAAGQLRIATLARRDLALATGRIQTTDGPSATALVQPRSLDFLYRWHVAAVAPFLSRQQTVSSTFSPQFFLQFFLAISLSQGVERVAFKM